MVAKSTFWSAGPRRGETEKRKALAGLIEEARTLAPAGADELGICVPTTLDQACGTALVDRIQIQQVVINLLRNAVEAMRGAVGLSICRPIIESHRGCI